MTERSVSSGVIVFREDRGKREYLILRNRNNEWEFPKGGVEGNETLKETALRELEEETGLGEIELFGDFKESYDYEFYSSNEKIKKTVHLFLGRTSRPEVILSKEHYDYRWEEFENAYNTLSHSATSRILSEAENFLDNHNKSKFE